VAKTRRGSRKGSPSKRAKAKGGARTGRKTTTRKAAPKRKGIELRPIRQKLRAHVATLSAVEQPSDRVRDSLERLNRALSEMDTICGPDMLIEIP
jgi:hypothetical protein